MVMRMMKWLLVCAMMMTPLSWAVERVYFNGTDWKGGYALVPDKKPDRGGKFWVAVDLHGAGGLRNEKLGVDLMRILEPESVIVIVPSFENGYQAGDGRFAKQLIEHFQWLAKRHPLHDKMFVHGHSGGAQFAHRFAFVHPERVSGVSAHSAGSWAGPSGYGTINLRAKRIPFLISCGENDTQKSVPDSPMTRIEWYQVFSADLAKKGFVFYGTTWPGKGHAVPISLYEKQLKECFLLGTKNVRPQSVGWKM
jgi:poly(3-hydroxybutyrate) depolymerase